MPRKCLLVGSHKKKEKKKKRKEKEKKKIKKKEKNTRISVADKGGVRWATYNTINTFTQLSLPRTDLY